MLSDPKLKFQKNPTSEFLFIGVQNVGERVEFVIFFSTGYGFSTLKKVYKNKKVYSRLNQGKNRERVKNSHVLSVRSMCTREQKSVPIFTNDPSLR